MLLHCQLIQGGGLILEFVQGLWFVNSMDKSLINPNQCQQFGIQIFNDPTNPHDNLVIESSEYLYILITMEESTFGTIIQHRTDNDIR